MNIFRYLFDLFRQSAEVIIPSYGLPGAYRRLHQGYWGNQVRTYQNSPGSWNPRYPYLLPKTEKSADLAHYFSGVAIFCMQKSQHIKHEKS